MHYVMTMLYVHWSNLKRVGLKPNLSTTRPRHNHFALLISLNTKPYKTKDKKEKVDIKSFLPSHFFKKKNLFVIQVWLLFELLFIFLFS